MKKRFTALLVVICMLVCGFVIPASVSEAQNNDEKYDSYVNMLPNTSGHAKYVVPNLYRQDASYTNVKTFPLVVNGGIEYFPLDIFALFPYLEVVYSKITHGFYINNTKNAHYIAFDVETGTTTTHDEQLTGVEAKIFNRTHYVPAKVVCEVLGMKFESYDDPKNGIRAARISDSKAKMTLAELVKAYSPTKKEPDETQTDNPEVVTPPDTGKDNPINPDVKDDPYNKIGTRYLHLTFDSVPDYNTEKTLDILKDNGVKAVFFVTKDRILSNPDTVRRIISEGHSVGIAFNFQNHPDSTVQNETIIDIINQTNNALYLVSKTKTRYVRSLQGYFGISDTDSFKESLNNAGYEVFDWNIDAGTVQNYTKANLDALVSNIVGINSRSERVLFIKFGTSPGSSDLLKALMEFAGKYTKFKFMTTENYTEKVSFMGK